MAGIYIHIPFCKQACHYCDFHFSTNIQKKETMVGALKREIELRKNELNLDRIETIYFGGGTPSILEVEEMEDLVSSIYRHYEVSETPEITLEANPDDLSGNKILQLSRSPVNRLSIGIQSFFDEDLKLMNRAHDAVEAENCINGAKKHFENISIDLIYGIPGMDNQRWKQNIDKALSFGIPHISSYALTVEPKTALKKFIEKGIVQDVDDNQAQEQFHLLMERLEEEGFVNYEISNFGRPGFFSQNNTGYWQGKKYIGVGPSAHSFDGERRGWNIANNSKYISALNVGDLPIEFETLSIRDRYNERVMTGLRTVWGVSLSALKKEFGKKYGDYLENQAIKFVEQGLLYFEGDVLLASKKGKFLVDGIASDLFMLNLGK